MTGATSSPRYWALCVLALALGCPTALGLQGPSGLHRTSPVVARQQRSAVVTAAETGAGSGADLAKQFQDYALPDAVMSQAGFQLPRIQGQTAESQAGDFSLRASMGSAENIGATMQKVDYPISSVLRRIDNNMILLDGMVGKKGQLSQRDLILLVTTLGTVAVSPFVFPLKVVELITPSIGALIAAVGISNEYIGRSAVATGKEMAAACLATAAEAEVALSQAERIKCVIPLAVGLSTTAAAFSLLAPALVETINNIFNVNLVGEVYLIWPLVAVLSAAIAGLAKQETVAVCQKAIGIGARRFASARSVGRTWKSSTEMIQDTADRGDQKWKQFALATIPAPVIALFFPGSISAKAVVCAAIAVAQTAYYLAIAEGELARAIDAVAQKTRSAAVSDTYANQGARSGALLPFTSALAGLCAAATAAVVEFLPLVPTLELQALTALVFPGFAAVLAAGASVSKARCEVDAAAAREAAESLAAVKEDGDDNVIKPVNSVIQLITLSAATAVSTTRRIARKVKDTLKSIFSKFTGGNEPPPTPSYV